MFSFKEKSKFDVICMGRVGVDLYADKNETDFENIQFFEKQIGGSAGNIAVGLVRSGSKVSFIGKVSDDMVGRFIYKIFQKENIYHTYLTFAPKGSRTTLALCEVKENNCQVVLYRNESADLYISVDDIDKSHIQESKILLFTGTGLSKEPSLSAHRKAVEIARNDGVYIVFDLDYRDYSWKNKSQTINIYQDFCDMSDMIVANKEEFEILIENNRERNIDELIDLYNQKNKEIVLKDGKNGVSIYLSERKQPLKLPIFPVQTLKPYGTGDAFLSNFLSYFLREKDIEKALLYGTAAGAWVVQRQGCAFAMPTKSELELFIKSFKK